MMVFISGITGTLGTALALLHKERGDLVVGCCRNEERASRWLAANPSVATVLLGDVDDVLRHTTMALMLERSAVCYHCAAMKHVDLCESNPYEAAVQNIARAHTVSLACREAGARFVMPSSDKACLPVGVYGATKLLAEKVCVADGGAACRLGNLIGSTGSVLALWKRARGRGAKLCVGDPEATRYFMTVQDAANFLYAWSLPGFVCLPDKLKAARMGDIADAIAGPDVVVTGPRAGDQRHQWLLAPDTAVTSSPGRIVLNDLEGAPHLGMCSKDAPRWDVAELVRQAGLNPFDPDVLKPAGRT